MTYAPPMYCADVPGSLFDKTNWGWDVSRLDSILSRTLKKKGLTLPAGAHTRSHFSSTSVHHITQLNP